MIRRVAGLVAELLLIGLLVAFIAATGLITLATVRGLPQTSGTIEARGLTAPATVVRTGRWVNGDTVELPFFQDAIARSAVATLTLTP
jgi:hypothetical protein